MGPYRKLVRILACISPLRFTVYGPTPKLDLSVISRTSRGSGTAERLRQTSLRISFTDVLCAKRFACPVWRCTRSPSRYAGLEGLCGSGERVANLFHLPEGPRPREGCRWCTREAGVLLRVTSLKGGARKTGQDCACISDRISVLV